MRLISKNCNHDYYDHMIGYGIDPNIVYIRKYEFFAFANGRSSDKNVLMTANKCWNSAMRHDQLRLSHTNTDRHEHVAQKGFVGFCGVLYPFLVVFTKREKVEAWKFDMSHLYDECFKKHFFYSVNDVVRFVALYPEHTGVRKFSSDPHLAEYFKTTVDGEVFEDLEVPLVAYDAHGWHLNPRLEDFSFARIKGGQQAFQEISAYISGVLKSKNEMKITRLSDKDMAVSKGFDDRSFRRDPTKRHI